MAAESQSGKRFGDLHVSTDALRDAASGVWYGEVTLIAPSGARTTIQGGPDLAMRLADILLELAVRLNALNCQPQQPTKLH